ncbi:zinc ABC transporter ATP-binding protein ZnuC [Actinobacillus succinogenes]|uniref:ABC transporter related n=1 Tax=Actinobacillus succinogenes (strain ATCC 55618 / DSM 22257 / CCUG 43843 / 130Z) TaxID=339671 RepID=A6VQC9_ACTSZ|nr:zinc ABC transporter ATP-binding protein ZnuC [Actinobacillus succinogenes]ABR75176.1 ABC transporter related [Actinobacillus succinogenes 130Z]PHI40429.1 zinc ABC transporter ATP-binding protein ZnuC [Actinobacillus succinogenes]
MKISAIRVPLVELDNISVIFGQKIALQNINLQIFPNTVITIVGPNGAGKSTLLKVLLKLQPPTTGSVKYNKNLRIGYVPQKIHLNHSLPLTVQKFLSLKKDVRPADIKNALEHLSISHLAQSAMQKLSGGEMQRVLLARAMLNKPNLLVLDEPTQGVDINGQAELYQLIHQARENLNCAILMVSHDLHIVMADTNEVVCINRHICCAGTPETVSNDPTFIQHFGDQYSKNVAFYTHHHNHRHNMHGDVCCLGNQSCSQHMTVKK